MKKNNSKFAKRLAQYGSFALAAVAASEANGQVIYTDVNPDFSGGMGSSYAIDINNDGIDDVIIENNTYISSYYSYSSYIKLFANPQGSNALLGSGSSFVAYPFALNAVDTISSGAGSFLNASYLDLMNYGGFLGNWIGVTNKYLGLEFDIAGSTHYGWIRLDVATNGDFVVKDYAFEATPGALIFAGSLVAPTCLPPTNLTVSNITTTSVDLSWDSEPNATNGYAWSVFNSGDDPATATAIDSGFTDSETTAATATLLTSIINYDVYIQSDCGTTDGQSVLAGPLTFVIPPPNDDLANATPLTLDASCSGDIYYNSSATAETGEPESDCGTTGVLNSVWFSFTAPDSGNVHISTDILPGLIDDSIISIYAAPTTPGDVTTLGTAVGCIDDGGDGWLSILNLNELTPGDTYYIQVDGYGEDTGTFCITVDNLGDFFYADGTWLPNPPDDGVNPVTAIDNVSIINGDVNLIADIEMNELEVMSGATLSVEQAMTLNGDLTNDGAIVFKNDATKLGQLGDMTGNTISGIGTVTVERYIPARDSDAGDVNGAYRFISSAVTSTDSIQGNWQEGAYSMGNPNSGYGMFITGAGGAANGFDETNANASSMSTFNNTTQAYVPISNTNIDVLTAGTAYSAYVWGDRGVDIVTGNDPQATSTTLRATGSLVTGNQAGPTMSSVAGGFNLIGNPYQAILDMNSVISSATNINSNFYYVWDPNLGTRGAYATVNLPNGPTTDGITTPSTSEANKYLMPGQAVWVVTENASAASLTFEESDKAITEDPTDVFRPATESAFMELQLFQADRYANGFTLSDAVRIDFSETGENTVLTNDAPKLSNIDENLGRSNGDDLLSVEKRALPTDGEVLPLFTNQYRTSNYVFNAVVSNLPEGATAFLMDNYLNLKTELVNGQATAVSFSVDASNVASIAPDRFDIIFERDEMGVNENNFTGISIHPNPVAGNEFFIAASGLSGEKVQVNLYNILGQKVFTIENTVNSNERVSVPTANLEAGVYLVEMNHSGKIFTGKVVVE